MGTIDRFEEGSKGGGDGGREGGSSKELHASHYVKLKLAILLHNCKKHVHLLVGFDRSQTCLYQGMCQLFPTLFE